MTNFKFFKDIILENASKCQSIAVIRNAPVDNCIKLVHSWIVKIVSLIIMKKKINLVSKNTMNGFIKSIKRHLH